MRINAGEVLFDYLNKSFLFDARDLELKVGDVVVVETDYGLDMGVLMELVKDREVDEKQQQIKKIVRAADEQDAKKLDELGPKEKKAFEVCLEEIEKAGLKMKLVNARYSFDCSRVSFCYTADGRVDFRELVKSLASRLRTRIELRQVGVRDEARLFGGFGPCGRKLCCSAFLRDFKSVSIKMAKEQGLPLNPLKISGVCGRLFCCLKYEYEYYMAYRKFLPDIGEIIERDGVGGRVASINVYGCSVTVRTEGGGWADIAFDVPDEELRKACAEACRCGAKIENGGENGADELPPENGETSAVASQPRKQPDHQPRAQARNQENRGEDK